MLNLVMKKKAPKKVMRSVKSPRSSRTNTKIIYIGFFTSLALLLAFMAIFNRPVMRQAVQGMSITRSLYQQAVVALPGIDGAVAYNIYYKATTDETFENSVRKIPATVQFYTISYLKPGVKYEYKITAVNSEGSEFWMSPVQQITGATGM